MTSALELITWLPLGLGGLFDLYGVWLVIRSRGTSSSVPIVGALLYLHAGLFRAALGLPSLWPLVTVLIGVHLLAHFLVIPRLPRWRAPRPGP